MANGEQPVVTSRPETIAGAQPAIDLGLRAFMLRIGNVVTASTRGCLFAALALFTLASAANADVRGPIRFAPGTTSASVGNAVVRGDRDIYRVEASAGQRMSVRVSAVDDNAAFQIYLPGASYRREVDGYEFSGRTLPGAGEGADATRWSGTLPASGPYLVVVGPTARNATYRLTVDIR